MRYTSDSAISQRMKAPIQAAAPVRSKIPSMPDFAAIEAVAHKSADRRTAILALIGNLVFSWSNNESMFLYLLMLLMETDEQTAAIVFATLNTSRARTELVQRLSAAKLTDPELKQRLSKVLKAFNRGTRIRNDFNHCIFSLNSAGEITHTHSLRIGEANGKLTLGYVRQFDDARMQQLSVAIVDMTRLNRDLWELVVALDRHFAKIASRRQPRA